MEVIKQNYQNAPKYQPAVPPKLKSKVNKNTIAQKNLEEISIKTNVFISQKNPVIFIQIACPSDFKRLLNRWPLYCHTISTTQEYFKSVLTRSARLKVSVASLGYQH